jgi:hypothetical protein
MTLPSASGGGRHKQTSHVDSGASGLPLRNVGRRSEAAIYAYMPLLLGLTRRRMLDPSSSPSAMWRLQNILRPDVGPAERPVFGPCQRRSC